MIYTKKDSKSIQPHQKRAGSTGSVGEIDGCRRPSRSALAPPQRSPKRKSATSVGPPDLTGCLIPISAPISDAGSHVDSPIFARKTVEDYYYDCWDVDPYAEDNSGVWMGPPDKREPKPAPPPPALETPKVSPKRNSSVISLNRDEDRSSSHQPTDKRSPLTLY